MDSVYDHPTFKALAEATYSDPTTAAILCDWLVDAGVSDAKAGESLLPPLVSRYLPHIYSGISIGSGIGIGIGKGGGNGTNRGSGNGRGTGQGSGRGERSFGFGIDFIDIHGGYGSGKNRGNGFEISSKNNTGVILMETGKAYLIHTVDWFAFVGRVVRQVGPWEYEFTSCSKICDTNNGDSWHLLCAGNQEERKKATYLHYTTPLIIGMGVVMKALWLGETPQEAGL